MTKGPVATDEECQNSGEVLRGDMQNPEVAHVSPIQRPDTRAAPVVTVISGAQARPMNVFRKNPLAEKDSLKRQRP